MRYKHISQKPYCCVPASISMILRRRGIKPPPQEEIAYELGVILPSDQKHLLPKSYSGKKPKAGFGTRINLKKYSLTSFFKKHNYPLKERYIPAEKLKTEKIFLDFLQKNIKERNDQLVCFNQGYLKGNKESWGHCAVVASVGESTITMCDPDPKQKRLRRVPKSKLYRAIKNHYKGGIWVIDGK